MSHTARTPGLNQVSRYLLITLALAAALTVGQITQANLLLDPTRSLVGEIGLNVLRAAILVVVSVLAWRGYAKGRTTLAQIRSRVRPPADAAGAVLMRQPRGIRRADLYIVAVLIIAALLWSSYRGNRYEFIKAGDHLLWKVDTRTGETFLCGRVLEEGKIAGSRCVFAEMPD